MPASPGRPVVRGSRSRRSDPGMGIDIDVRDEGQFEVLSDLVPYTIHAEGWRDGRQVFSASDSGTSLWIEVTQEQEAVLLSRSGLLGIPSGALTVLAPGRSAGLSKRVATARSRLKHLSTTLRCLYASASRTGDRPPREP